MPVWFLYAAGGAVVLWLLGQRKDQQVTPLDQRQVLGPPAGDPALTKPPPTSVEPVAPPGAMAPIVAPSSPAPPAIPLPSAGEILSGAVKPVCPPIDLGLYDPNQRGSFLISSWNPDLGKCWPQPPAVAPVVVVPPAPPPLPVAVPPPPAAPIAVATGQLAAKAAVAAVVSGSPAAAAPTIMKPVDPPPATRTEAVFQGFGPSLSQAVPTMSPLAVYRPTGVGTTTPPSTVPPNTIPPPAFTQPGFGKRGGGGLL